MSKPKLKVDYQALSDELDDILAALQQPELDVDKSLAYYERGLKLVQTMEKYLETAGNRVAELKARFDQTGK